MFVLLPALLCILSIPDLTDSQAFVDFGDHPNYRTDPRFQIEAVLPTQGSLYGFKVPYEKWYDSRYTQLDLNQRLIQNMNIFLGVPYAKPPLTSLRFKAPEKPQPWHKDDPYNVKGKYNATFYRPICPQNDMWVKETYKGYLNHVNVSEDCLYLNIWRPDLIEKRDQPDYRYPVIVFIHGGKSADFMQGAAQQYPGFVLAQYGVMVVSINYRLGALGFLSTENHHAEGNYGFQDVVAALEWIKINIQYFYGDPERVTVMGHDSGAALVSTMLISPYTRKTKDRALFQRAILMSGSDVSEWAYVTPEWRPHEYAAELGVLIGCEWRDQEQLLDCMRARSDIDIARVAAKVDRKWGARSGPWCLVSHRRSDVLDDAPPNLRESGYFTKLPILAGVTKSAGAEYLSNYAGLFGDFEVEKKIFQKIILEEIVHKQRIHSYETKKLVDALTFEYTFWSNPDNQTASMENLVSLFTDYYFGTGVDGMMKSQNSGDIKKNPLTYSYVFDYRSTARTSPKWMGAEHHDDLIYAFGIPMFNKTIQELHYVDYSKYKFTRDQRDANFSDYWMRRIVDFATSFPVKTIVYTPQQAWPTWNFTWWPYNMSRVASARLFEWPHHVYNWHVNHYAFWRWYFDEVVTWIPLVSTTFRVPVELYSYQISTFIMATCFVVALILLAALIIVIWRMRKNTKDSEETTGDLSYM